MRNNSGTTGWLQYRFGQPGAIELRYPETKRDSFSKFKSGHDVIHMTNVEVNFDSVSFVSGGAGYHVESSSLASGKLKEGVTVGDPWDFDLPLSGKPRSRYPKAFISCAAKADTHHFYALIEHLRE